MSRSPHPPITPAEHSRSGGWFWIIPALTFAVGLLLGGTLIATTGDRSRDGAPATVSPTSGVSIPTGSPGDRTIVVPASCEQGLHRARAALSTAGDLVSAARSLDTARLQRLLDELQDAQADVEGLADRCRAQVRERN